MRRWAGGVPEPCSGTVSEEGDSDLPYMGNTQSLVMWSQTCAFQGLLGPLLSMIRKGEFPNL